MINRDALSDTLGLMLIGMALFRCGFFSGDWSRRTYWLVAAPVPLLWLGLCPARRLARRDARIAPLTMIATDAIQLDPAPPVPQPRLCRAGHPVRAVGPRGWLADRLAAAGRMAFSNYLGTSIICTLFFNGYGLGWYGYLQRWQYLIVVAVVWLLMLAWSKPWLDRFAYGPFEWLWRSAARGRAPALRAVATELQTPRNSLANHSH